MICGYLRRIRDLLNGKLLVLRVGARQGVGLPRHIARWTAPPHAVGHCRGVGWMSPVWRIVRSARPLVCLGWQHPCQSRSTSSPDGCHLDCAEPSKFARPAVHRAHRRRRQCLVRVIYPPPGAYPRGRTWDGRVHKGMAVMREVPVYGWPKPFRPSHLHWGPQGDELCPCGSRRRARSCHLAPDGWWLTPSAPPLLGDERTGYRHPGCYASTSSDCSSRLSREHWLSASVLNAFAPITVSGMPWQHGSQHTLPVRNLGAKVLCERHNKALSPLASSRKSSVT